MLKVSLRGEDSFGAPGSTKQDSLNELAADKVAAVVVGKWCNQQPIFLGERISIL